VVLSSAPKKEKRREKEKLLTWKSFIPFEFCNCTTHSVEIIQY
jgi:hypothetical protein